MAGTLWREFWLCMYGELPETFLVLAWPFRSRGPNPDGPRLYIPSEEFIPAVEADRVVSLISSRSGRPLELTDAHHGILPRRSVEFDQVLLNTFYADIDAITPWTWDAIADLVEPTAVVHSGRGLHLYWRLTEPIGLEEWKQGTRALYRSLISDPVESRAAAREAGDPTHLFRLPGGHNYRYRPPRRVEILRVSGERHTWTDVRQALTPFWDESQSPHATTARLTTDDVGELLAGVGRGGRNTAAISLAGHLRAYGLPIQEIGAWLELWNLKNRPPLSFRELHKIVTSIARYPVTPTIAPAVLDSADLATLYQRFPGLHSTSRHARAGAVLAALRAHIEPSDVMAALASVPDPDGVRGAPDRLIRWAQHHIDDGRK